MANVSLTMTSVDLVRGALATVHASVKPGVQAKHLWKAYRAAAAENPFLRVVKEQRGIYRVPEPKILAGSNYADLGFELDESSRHVIAICAIDNLMKGAAGRLIDAIMDLRKDKLQLAKLKSGGEDIRARIEVALDVRNRKQLEHILAGIRRIPGVFDIERVYNV